MANYIGTLFISKLPFCHEKMEMINGKEKLCLVIPCEEAQIDRTRHGEYFVRLYITELEPNPRLKTHNIAIAYRNMAEFEKQKNTVQGKKVRRLGHLFLYNDQKELKVDRTNNMTPIICDGKLFLDSIQQDDIKVDPNTGRKYLNITFRKTDRLDAFYNSHEVVVKTDLGEYQIGVAKEVVNNSTPVKSPVSKEEDEKYKGYTW